MSAPVPQGLVRTHVTQREDPGLPGQHRFDSEPQLAPADFPSRSLKRQMVAIQSDPRTHHGVPGFSPRNNGSSIGRVNDRRIKSFVAQETAYVLESSQLV